MAPPWTYYRDNPSDYPISTGWSQGRLFPPTALVGRIQLWIDSDPTLGVTTALDVVELPTGDLVGLSSWAQIMENDGRAEFLKRCAQMYDEMQRCFDPFPE